MNTLPAWALVALVFAVGMAWGAILLAALRWCMLHLCIDGGQKYRKRPSKPAGRSHRP